MHFVLLCDLHLSERTEESVFSILSYVSYQVKHSPDTALAILGDMYDTVYKDSQIDARLQQRLYDFFKNNFTKDTLFLLPGNHDLYGSRAQDNALNVFQHVATVYNEPVVAHNVLWLPYKDGGYPRDFIASMKCKVCFTHNDFKYLLMRKGLMSPQGMDPAIFKNMDYVFNGHYHYSNEQDNVVCVGSQYAVHKTEICDQKYLYNVCVSEDETTCTRTKVRFGRRTFTFTYDYCKELHETLWSRFHAVHPLQPISHDHLIIEYDDEEPDISEFTERLACTIQLRKKVRLTDHKPYMNDIDLTASPHQVIDIVAKELYARYEDDWEAIRDNIVDVWGDFHAQHESIHLAMDKTHVTFQTLVMENFCNHTGKISVRFEPGTMKIDGKSGAGKTVRYPTAISYALSGTMDTRFSEHRVLLSDMRCDKSSPCCVELHGMVNEQMFSIKRIYTGKKTKVEFTCGDENYKKGTIRQIQKEICKHLFNLHVPAGTCPNRHLNKVLLQRILWKQGNRDSNLMKLSYNEYTKTMLELLDQAAWGDFLKFAKAKVSERKKTLDCEKQTIHDLEMQLIERKSNATTEDIRNRAWGDHRKRSLMEWKEELKEIEHMGNIDLLGIIGQFIEKAAQGTPTTELVNGVRTQMDTFTEYIETHQQLKTKITQMVDNNEGLRWGPELATSKMVEVSKELASARQKVGRMEHELQVYERCAEVARLATEAYIAKAGSIMEHYGCNIALSKFKLHALVDATPLKYLSGGQYQHECLKAFLTMQAYVKDYANWSCNLMVLDEPGTAMDTGLLQAFVDQLPSKCNIVITHKDIVCDGVVCV